MALLTNWVWLVGKSDFKIMFPRELFLFSLLSSNKDCFLVGKSSLALNGLGLLTKHLLLGVFRACSLQMKQCRVVRSAGTKGCLVFSLESYLQVVVARICI